MMRSMMLVLTMLAATVSPGAPALAQFHEPDREAMKAFEEVVSASRKREALTVKTTIEIEVLRGDIVSDSEEVKAEFLLAPQGAGKREAVIKLRGFTVFVGDGRLNAVHDDRDDAYFTVGDDGSPYYALMYLFQALPYPHLALVLGEEDIDDVLMQFHSKAPWIRPTKVSRETPEGREGKTLQRIKLTSDFESIDLFVDPETKLIDSLELRVTSGPMVQAGATLIYRHSYEYEVHDKAPIEAMAFDPGDRARVDSFISLRPAPEARPARGGRGGVTGGSLVGKPAPDFTLDTIDGSSIELKNLRGRVVVIDFWATWCGPCVQAMPLLHEVAAWAKEQSLPVEVIAVNVWESPAVDERLQRAKDFWEQRKLTLPVAMDLTDETVQAYGVTGIPSTFVIRPDGTVHAQHVGAGPNYVEQLKAEIKEAINAAEW